MAAPQGALEAGGFKVVFSHGGQLYALWHLASAEDADLVCDLLTLKEAIDEQLDSNALQLCSLHLTSLTSGQLRDALCTLRGSELRTTSFDQVVEQVQACALKAAELERMQAPVGVSLLHAAALLGYTSIVQLLLLAEPQKATAASYFGHMPLHLAAQQGHTAAAELLLDSALQAAMAPDIRGYLPLHLAALKGHSAMVQLLLSFVPQSATCAAKGGWLPLHSAAHWGHTTTVQLLLDRAPQAATLLSLDGSTPLQLALASHKGPHLDAARCLLAAGPAPAVLAALLAAGPVAMALFTDFTIARVPMTSKEWAAMPTPCPGIGRALPAVLAHSAEQARQLVRHLPPADAQRLRTAALSLHRAQKNKQLHVFLPSPIVWHILALSAT